MLPLRGDVQWQRALEESGVLDRLAAFDPRIAGTFPLGLDLPGSDIDVVCHAADLDAFAKAVWQHFAACEGFALWQWSRPPHAVIAGFRLAGVPFEIFGSPEPVDEQAGWRHFLIEQALLELGGAALLQAVRAERARGAKTEPAFAKVLGLDGDPYVAMLALEAAGKAQWRARLASAGFSLPGQAETL